MLVRIHHDVRLECRSSQRRAVKHPDMSHAVRHRASRRVRDSHPRSAMRAQATADTSSVGSSTTLDDEGWVCGIPERIVYHTSAVTQKWKVPVNLQLYFNYRNHN